MSVSEGLRSQQFSVTWELAERRTVQRCLDLKFLKILTRGKRKNQIELNSPKWNSTPQHGEEAVLPAHVHAHAYVAKRRREEGIYLFVVSDFLAVADTPLITDPQLNESVSIIGDWLEIVVRVWNELGDQWPDLWDIFHGPGQENDPFLQFYELCQRARHSGKAPRNGEEMQQEIVKTLVGSAGAQRAPLERNGPAVGALQAVGITQGSIRDLSETFALWQATRESWEHFRSDLGSERASPSPGASGPWKNASFRDRWNDVAMLLKFNQVVLEVNNNRVHTGAFSVDVVQQLDSLLLRPRISIGNLSRIHYLRFAITLHEMGHFVLHSTWLGELSLMRVIRDRLATNLPGVGKLIETTIVEAQTYLVAFHSALEEAADEFALAVLLTDDDLNKLKEKFTDKDGNVHLLLFRAVLGKVGIYKKNTFGPDEEYDALYTRFWKLIDDRMQIGNPFHPKLIPTRDLRAMMHEVSRNRAELLLDSLWSEISQILSGNRTTTVSRIRKSSKSQAFSFDGITCK